VNKYPDYKYPEKLEIKHKKWPNNIIKKAPIWCSVDLRDGNQALPIPMTPIQKSIYFKMLTDIGFKQIEVAFPSASKDDFDFVRNLIENNLVPKDVKISVLTQARKHLIEKTVESLKGTTNAILHCYVATSDLHSKIVFNKTRNEVMQMAVEGTKLVVENLEAAGLKDYVAYEFSPEEFTDSDIDFVIKLSEQVKEIWKPKNKADFILNLPATVERKPPNYYADMIEYFCSNYKYREETTISLHSHNDQGCAVAATELAVLAGADRVEGTLLGHGERTGNVDIITFALNLHSRGIDTNLDFSNLPSIVETVEETSGILVHPRHPYAGNLVFTAFSGSHQDAIRKGMKNKDKAAELFHINWKIPYLHINPLDIGKKYEQLIRINSQSGKGGIAYVLEKDFGLRLPKAMHPELGTYVQALADKKGSEISSSEVYELFKKKFVQIIKPYQLISVEHISPSLPNSNDISIKIKIEIYGVCEEFNGNGNGPISAVVHALKKTNKIIDFNLEDFEEQSTGQSADSVAMAYVTVKRKSDGVIFCGAGQNSNIDWAAIYALIAALNKAAGDL
jgi:2-isopropylmalate synthase